MQHMSIESKLMGCQVNVEMKGDGFSFCCSSFSCCGRKGTCCIDIESKGLKACREEVGQENGGTGVRIC